jgi:regulator of nonsense transcripts 3
VLHCRFSDGRSCAVAASQPPAPPTTTPLLEALKAEKSAQKDKEAILRNHAHYKDSAAVNASRKEEAKKKAPPATVAPQRPEPGPAPLSRKAKKAAAAQKAVSPAQAAQATPAAKGVSVEGANLPAKPPPHVPAVRTTPRSPRAARHQAPKVPATVSLPPKPAAQTAPCRVRVTGSACKHSQRTSSRWSGAAVRSCVERRCWPRRRKET